eukprot:SAG11_NODE_25398_length_359_cov_0.911538_1_plen_98_part_10
MLKLQHYTYVPCAPTAHDLIIQSICNISLDSSNSSPLMRSMHLIVHIFAIDFGSVVRLAIAAPNLLCLRGRSERLFSLTCFPRLVRADNPSPVTYCST